MPALAYVRAVCEVLVLDAAVGEEVAWAAPQTPEPNPTIMAPCRRSWARPRWRTCARCARCWPWTRRWRRRWPCCAATCCAWCTRASLHLKPCSRCSTGRRITMYPCIAVHCQHLAAPCQGTDGCLAFASQAQRFVLFCVRDVYMVPVCVQRVKA